MRATTIDLGLAEHAFQVHGADPGGLPMLGKQLRRSEMARFFACRSSCLIGMEACATAHRRARELLWPGHEARLVRPAYVERGTTDETDAAAIGGAVARPTMRFVPIRSAGRRSALMLHRIRGLPVRQWTVLANAPRGHMARFGIAAMSGIMLQRLAAAAAVDHTDATRSRMKSDG